MSDYSDFDELYFETFVSAFATSNAGGDLSVLIGLSNADVDNSRDDIISLFCRNEGLIEELFLELSDLEIYLGKIQESISGFQLSLAQSAADISQMKVKALILSQGIKNRRLACKEANNVYSILQECDSLSTTILRSNVDDDFLTSLHELELKVEFLSENPQLRSNGIVKELQPQIKKAVLQAANKIFLFFRQQFICLVNLGQVMSLTTPKDPQVSSDCSFSVSLKNKEATITSSVNSKDFLDNYDFLLLDLEAKGHYAFNFLKRYNFELSEEVKRVFVHQFRLLYTKWFTEIASNFEESTKQVREISANIISSKIAQNILMNQNITILLKELCLHRSECLALSKDNAQLSTSPKVEQLDYSTSPTDNLLGSTLTSGSSDIYEFPLDFFFSSFDHFIMLFSLPKEGQKKAENQNAVSSSSIHYLKLVNGLAQSKDWISNFFFLWTIIAVKIIEICQFVRNFFFLGLATCDINEEAKLLQGFLSSPLERLDDMLQKTLINITNGLDCFAAFSVLQALKLYLCKLNNPHPLSLLSIILNTGISSLRCSYQLDVIQRNLTPISYLTRQLHAEKYSETSEYTQSILGISLDQVIQMIPEISHTVSLNVIIHRFKRTVVPLFIINSLYRSDVGFPPNGIIDSKLSALLSDSIHDIFEIFFRLSSKLGSDSGFLIQLLFLLNNVSYILLYWRLEYDKVLSILNLPRVNITFPHNNSIYSKTVNPIVPVTDIGREIDDMEFSTWTSPVMEKSYPSSFFFVCNSFLPNAKSNSSYSLTNMFLISQESFSFKLPEFPLAISAPAEYLSLQVDFIVNTLIMVILLSRPFESLWKLLLYYEKSRENFSLNISYGPFSSHLMSLFPTEMAYVFNKPEKLALVSLFSKTWRRELSDFNEYFSKLLNCLDVVNTPDGVENHIKVVVKYSIYKAMQRFWLANCLLGQDVKATFSQQNEILIKVISETTLLDEIKFYLV